MLKQTPTWLLAALLALSVAGCSNSGNAQENTSSRPISSTLGTVQRSEQSSTPTQADNSTAASDTSSTPIGSVIEAASSSSSSAAGSSMPATTSTPSSRVEADTGTASSAASSDVLSVHFGDNGDPFTMHLYDNDTAAAIAGYVGTADWRLPIYNFDGYENWEVMQFYDLPSRYEIPSNPEAVTSQKAGEVYYSDPNRIVLFYQDATVSAEYTKIGYFDATEAFVSAVQSNPVLEGWGNKIVLIKD